MPFEGVLKVVWSHGQSCCWSSVQRRSLVTQVLRHSVYYALVTFRPPLSWSLQGLHCSTSILSGSVLDLHVYEAIVPVIGPFSTHVPCTAWSKPWASSWLSPTRLPIYRRSPFLFCSEQIYLFLSLPPSNLEYVKETALFGVGGHVALTVGRW